MDDIFGIQSDEMCEVCPTRPHPANPKVKQWRVGEDYCTMQVEKAKGYRTTGSQKLTGAQAEGLKNAMDLCITDDTLQQLECDFENPNYKKMLEELLELNRLSALLDECWHW